MRLNIFVMRIGCFESSLITSRELRRYRAQPFLEPHFEGIRRFDRDLIELFRKEETLSDEEILDRFGVDPSETEYVRAILKQLEILGEYGLIEFTGKGLEVERQAC